MDFLKKCVSQNDLELFGIVVVALIAVRKLSASNTTVAKYF